MARPERKDTGGFFPKDKEGHSVSEIFKELSASAKNLIQSEVNLARAELKETAGFFGRQSAQAAAFGGLLALSVLPFLAFLVIGLGGLMGDRYWLSSLIVALVCAAVGGGLSYRAYRRIKDADLTLPRTRENLQHETKVLSLRTQDIKESASDRVRDIRDNMKRRAA